MTQEEILQQGAPVEPNCFETDREEQWYKVGLHEGATASPWHSVKDGDLPKESKGNPFDLPYLVRMNNGRMFPAYYNIEDGTFTDEFNKSVKVEIGYWMEIPGLPK